MSDTRPIGVFDSGIGGLTVLREIHRRLPGETLIYLGDTARVPYGSKSKQTVVRYSKNNVRFFDERGVKMIVVACNTASAYALPELNSGSKPVIGVVEGGVEAAVKQTKGNIGVIGTEATILSRAYAKAIKERMPECDVISKPCPLFVPLAEEGWTANAVADAVAHEYLDEMRDKIDTLVLGCTHYPPLKNTIGRVLGPDVALIDSAEETARTVDETLRRLGLMAEEERGAIRIYVTDSPQRSHKVGRRMLGDIEIDSVELVDIS